MSANKNSLSFGHYLKSVRLEKGIDLKEVAQATKIGMDNLLLIEKEDHYRLPAEVFVKGFVRAYAQAVGADGDEAVERYMSNRRIFDDAAGFDADLKKSDQEYWPRLLLSLVALLGIMVVSVFVMSFFHHKPSEIDSKSNVSEPIGRDTPSKDMYEPYTAKGPVAEVPEKLLLKIVSVEDTWMKIIIDGENTKEYYLRPKDFLELEAVSSYNLLIGNAAGVNLTLNGKPIKISGKSGQVIKIKIP